MSYIPVIKTLLPLVGPIVNAAAPLFTKSSEKENEAKETQIKQISELQVAVKKNAELIATLANSLQKTVAEFDKREENAQEQIASLKEEIVKLKDENQKLKVIFESSRQNDQVGKYLNLTAILIAIISLVIVYFK